MIYERRGRPISLHHRTDTNARQLVNSCSMQIVDNTCHSTAIHRWTPANNWLLRSSGHLSLVLISDFENLVCATFIPFVMSIHKLHRNMINLVKITLETNISNEVFVLTKWIFPIWWMLFKTLHKNFTISDKLRY